MFDHHGWAVHMTTFLHLNRTHSARIVADCVVTQSIVISTPTYQMNVSNYICINVGAGCLIVCPRPQIKKNTLVKKAWLDRSSSPASQDTTNPCSPLISLDDKGVSDSFLADNMSNGSTNPLLRADLTINRPRFGRSRVFTLDVSGADHLRQLTCSCARATFNPTIDRILISSSSTTNMELAPVVALEDTHAIDTAANLMGSLRWSRSPNRQPQSSKDHYTELSEDSSHQG